jgi:hypothetical protein
LPADEGAPAPSTTAVAALLVGCSAMVVLTAWWWVWGTTQFGILLAY